METQVLVLVLTLWIEKKLNVCSSFQAILSFFFLNAADASTSDDQLDSSFVDSQFGTQCPTLSTDSDPAVCVDQSCQGGIL